MPLNAQQLQAYNNPAHQGFFDFFTIQDFPTQQQFFNHAIEHGPEDRIVFLIEKLSQASVATTESDVDTDTTAANANESIEIYLGSKPILSVAIAKHWNKLFTVLLGLFEKELPFQHALSHILYNPDNEGYRPLQRAIMRNLPLKDIEIIIKLGKDITLGNDKLIDLGNSFPIDTEITAEEMHLIDLKMQKTRPLYLAIKNNNLALVQLFIQNGATINKLDIDLALEKKDDAAGREIALYIIQHITKGPILASMGFGNELFIHVLNIYQTATGEQRNQLKDCLESIFITSGIVVDNNTLTKLRPSTISIDVLSRHTHLFELMNKVGLTQLGQLVNATSDNDLRMIYGYAILNEIENKLKTQYPGREQYSADANKLKNKQLNLESGLYEKDQSKILFALQLPDPQPSGAFSFSFSFGGMFSNDTSPDSWKNLPVQLRTVSGPSQKAGH